jgi:uncharacterized protein (DUF2225 family)
MQTEEIEQLAEETKRNIVLTNEDIKQMVEQNDYSDVREIIQGMTQYELQTLYYWGFRTRKHIFCSAAAGLLKEHYGVTPNYELCSERTSEYT